MEKMPSDENFMPDIEILPSVDTVMEKVLSVLGKLSVPSQVDLKTSNYYTSKRGVAEMLDEHLEYQPKLFED